MIDNAYQSADSLAGDGRPPVDAGAQYGGGQTRARYTPRPKKVKHDQIIFLASQLAIMVDTGVPIDEALDSIAEQTDHSGLKALVEDISERVKGGSEFSSALENHPKVFDTLFISLMRASEASGTMGQMLVRASDYMESERDTRKQVKGAMIYPASMMSFCVLVVIGLMVFILPRFEKIYAGKGAALPLPTRILMGISRGLIDYWPFIIAGLTAIITGGVLYFRSPNGKMMLDKLRITIPIIGPMYRKACLAKSLRTLATMVTSGVSMLEGLAITATASGNYYYQKIWTDLAESVKEGSNLADPLYKSALIPRTVSQMISAGEKTGRLGTVMDRVADHCESDLKIAVKAITMMIEPIMIIVMGVIVGGIAMALLLPVFSIAKVMTK